jgi:hypothetical protein
MSALEWYYRSIDQAFTAVDADPTPLAKRLPMSQSSSQSSRHGLMVVVTILVLGAMLLSGIIISSLALMS